MVHDLRGDAGMSKAKNRKKTHIKARETGAMRASVSFPRSIYGSLGAIARRKKVSLAWVVRDAAEKYVAEEEGNDQTQEHSSDRTVRRTVIHSREAS